jgi:hypothetical protein
MKKILFMANFEKTNFYINVSKFLENFEIYWIVVNLKQYNYLKEKFDTKNILYINKKSDKSINENFIFKDLKVNELLFLDRCLQQNNIEDKNYLENSQFKIYNFLKKNKISYIFGEFTWAHEILTYRICKNYPELNTTYLNPGDIRLISTNFLFFLDPQQSSFLEKTKKDIFTLNDLDLDNYKKYLKTVDPKKKLFDFKLIFFKLFKIFFNDYYDKSDPTFHGKIKRIKNFLGKFLNYYLFNFIKKKKLSDLKNKKYIIYFLQKKPEASLDVKGLYYSDHIKNIEIIWKILPTDFDLIIKEHPSCIGDNNLKFYRTILNMNRIFFIEKKCGFDELVKKSFCTFSVSTTASMESAILKIPSFTFSNCFFNEMKFCKNISLEDIRKCKNLESLVKSLIEENKNKSFLENLKFLKNSFEGSLYGEKMNSEKNLKNFARAINEVFN